MKKFLFMAAVSALALSGGKAMAADISATGEVSARIVEQLSVAQIVPLNFGAVLAGENVITITPGGLRSATDGAKLVGGDGQSAGTYTSAAAAQFTISGPVGAKPKVTFGATSVQIASGENTMTVDNFISNAASEANEIKGTAGGTGELTFRVGADLHVAANQAPGDYTGTYTVNVHY